MSECYKILEYIWDNINKQIGCSFDTLNELNNDGKIEKIFNRFSYIIGLYCGNKDVYRKLPLYVKTLLEKFDIYYLSPYFEERNMYKIKVALEEEKVYKKI